MQVHLKSKPIITGLALVLLFSSLSFKCGGGGGSQPSDPMRKAAKAADDLAGAINQMIKVKRSLAQQGKLSTAEESALTDLLLKVNTADKVFVTQLKAIKGAPDAATKTNLANLFAQVTSTLDELNNKGLLPLGNADAKSTLTKILAVATAAAKIIQETLGA